MHVYISHRHINTLYSSHKYACTYIHIYAIYSVHRYTYTYIQYTHLYIYIYTHICMYAHTHNDPATKLFVNLYLQTMLFTIVCMPHV